MIIKQRENGKKCINCRYTLEKIAVLMVKTHTNAAMNVPVKATLPA